MRVIWKEKLGNEHRRTRLEDAVCLLLQSNYVENIRQTWSKTNIRLRFVFERVRLDQSSIQRIFDGMQPTQTLNFGSTIEQNELNLREGKSTKQNVQRLPASSAKRDVKEYIKNTSRMHQK